MTTEKKSNVLTIYFYTIITSSVITAIPDKPQLISISLLLLMLGGAVFFQILYYFYFQGKLTNKTKELYPTLYEKYKSLNRDWKTYSIYVDNFYTSKYKNEMEKDYRELENKEVTELFFISRKCSRFAVISVFMTFGILLMKLIMLFGIY